MTHAGPRRGLVVQMWPHSEFQMFTMLPGMVKPSLSQLI